MCVHVEAWQGAFVSRSLTHGAHGGMLYVYVEHDVE